MRFTTNIGFLLLAILLILWGLTLVMPQFAIPTLILGILAIVSGVFILIGR